MTLSHAALYHWLQKKEEGEKNIHEIHAHALVYSGTLECDHPDNLTTLLIGPLFGRPVLDFLYNLIIATLIIRTKADLLI